MKLFALHIPRSMPFGPGVSFGFGLTHNQERLLDLLRENESTIKALPGIQIQEVDILVVT